MHGNEGARAWECSLSGAPLRFEGHVFNSFVCIGLLCVASDSESWMSSRRRLELIYRSVDWVAVAAGGVHSCTCVLRPHRCATSVESYLLALMIGFKPIR